MSSALIVASDLMARSRLELAAKAEGVAVSVARSLGEPPASDPPSLVVIDLDEPGALDAVPAWLGRWPQISFVGFASHVDQVRRAAAEALGITVITRGDTARRGRELFRAVPS